MQIGEIHYCVDDSVKCCLRYESDIDLGDKVEIKDISKSTNDNFKTVTIFSFNKQKTMILHKGNIEIYFKSEYEIRMDKLKELI